jgi:hypothetical protein
MQIYRLIVKAQTDNLQVLSLAERQVKRIPIFSEQKDSLRIYKTKDFFAIKLNAFVYA